VGEGDVLPVEDVQDRDARLGDRLVGMDAHALHVDVEDGEVIRQAGPVVLLQVGAVREVVHDFEIELDDAVAVAGGMAGVTVSVGELPDVEERDGVVDHGFQDGADGGLPG